MKITISGTPGSGKSVVAKKLCDKLNLKYYDLGKIRRSIAEKHNITLAELNKLGETESWTDKEPDDEMARIGKEQNSFVFVGRLAYHFIPDSIKIFLKCNLEEGAKRISNDTDESRKSENYNSIKEMTKKIKEREKSDLKRYEHYYNVNYMEESNYDLIIDTTNLTIDEVLEKIMKFIECC
jgi:cytidylate kinase